MTEIVMVPASSGPVMVADDGEVLVAQASGPQIITAGIGAGGATGAKGDPGSNVMAIGLLKDTGLLAVPGGTDLVQTSGNESVGVGVSKYVADASITSGYLTAHPKSGFRDSGGRGFRIVSEEPLMPQKFYQATDADFFDAVQRCVSYSLEVAQTGYGYGRGGPRVFTPKGHYVMGGRVVELTHTLNFGGDSMGGPSGGGTVFEWTDNTITAGIRTQHYNTSGASGGPVATSYDGADMTEIHHMHMIGPFAGTEGPNSAIQLRTKAYAHDIFGQKWGDYVVKAIATATSGTWEGNDNDAVIERIFGQDCRATVYVEGLDTNSIELRKIDGVLNRQATIHVGGNIGLNIKGGNSSSCGQIAGFPTMVSYSGNHYSCIAGQEAWCSTHAPSGTTANNTGWAYVSAGAPTSARPAWVNGTTYRAGGPVIFQGASNYSTIIGLYAETDQGPSQLDGHVVWICPLGGNAIGPDGSVYGGQIAGILGGIMVPRSFYSGDTVAWGQMVLTENANEPFRFKPGASGTQLYMGYGGGFYAFNDTNGHQLLYFNTNNGRLGPIDTESVFKVNGNQVVGARQTRPGTPTLADVVALLDAWQAWA